MSRRKGDFQHRTAIFEGAYRAWSHLGYNCSCHDVMNCTAAELDPLVRRNDPTDLMKERALHIPTNSSNTSDKKGDTSTKGKDKIDEKETSEKEPIINTNGVNKKNLENDDFDLIYPYEPLPRVGIAHPFVESIIAAWLGAASNRDDIVYGIATLRTWWQHRRRGRSTSAIETFSKDKMQQYLDGYTRHFFNYAHSLLMRNIDLGPTTLKRKLESLGIYKISHNSHVDKDRKSSTIKSQLTSNIIPLIYVHKNDLMMAMEIKGMKCFQCMAVIEVGLKGVHGTKSHIDGLLDVIVDFHNKVLLAKISDIENAPMIYQDIKQTLNVFGYDAICKSGITLDEIPEIVDEDKDEDQLVDTIYNSFQHKDVILGHINERVQQGKEAQEYQFDCWKNPCTCPQEDELFIMKCIRHTEFDCQEIMDSFQLRKKIVLKFLQGKLLVKELKDFSLTIKLKPFKSKKRKIDQLIPKDKANEKKEEQSSNSSQDDEEEVEEYIHHQQFQPRYNLLQQTQLHHIPHPPIENHNGDSSVPYPLLTLQPQSSQRYPNPMRPIYHPYHPPDESLILPKSDDDDGN